MFSEQDKINPYSAGQGLILDSKRSNKKKSVDHYKSMRNLVCSFILMNSQKLKQFSHGVAVMNMIVTSSSLVTYASLVFCTKVPLEPVLRISDAILLFNYII